MLERLFQQLKSINFEFSALKRLVKNNHEKPKLVRTFKTVLRKNMRNQIITESILEIYSTNYQTHLLKMFFQLII